MKKSSTEERKERFQESVETILKVSNLSRKQFSKIMEVDVSTVGNWENGIHSPGLDLSHLFYYYSFNILVNTLKIEGARIQDLEKRNEELSEIIKCIVIGASQSDPN